VKRFTEGGAVRAEVVLGEPAREIVAAAARAKADLIVMDRTGSPRTSAEAGGPRACKVGILCRCPCCS
jgi:nucleotide-binding universal stress UspA family protein